MGREVAIKVAAEQFGERFSREVHAVAALNHPNICHLYDVGPNYLVYGTSDASAMSVPVTSNPVFQPGELKCFSSDP
jgi:serine/threonine protein kinase